MIRKIVVPAWLEKGLRMLRGGFDNRLLAGLDTETIRGEPYTYQIWSPERQTFKCFKSPGSITLAFLREVQSWPEDTTFWVHHLYFDLYVLLWKFRKAFVHSHFLLHAPGFELEAYYGDTVNFATLHLNGKRYRFLDTFAFFKTSLQALSERFKLPPKMRKPPKLGERRYQGKQFEYFRRYAMRDAEVAYYIGKLIAGFHETYDIPASVSAPQMSAYIFRKRYIPKGKHIPMPPKRCAEACQLSYHGGKNGMYVNPGVYDSVYLYDINSAYPRAFTMLPNFLECRYVWTREVRPGEWGVVCVSGDSVDNPYNPLRDHRFSRIVGPFTRVWITTPEYAVIKAHSFVKDLTVHEGWTVASGPGYSPLAAFAFDFYKLKSQESGPLREFYKIVLNSLYGKFIQNIRDEENEYVYDERGIQPLEAEYVAGGLFNPMIATLITGWVRAHLTVLEIKYHALHSSTDSIITHRRIRTGNRLGEMSLKGQGSILLLRSKLYVQWDRERRITNYALHGFHGYLSQLLSLLRSGNRTYTHSRMVRVLEGSKQGKTPLTFERFCKRINLPFSGPLDIPKLLWKRADGREVQV